MPFKRNDEQERETQNKPSVFIEIYFPIDDQQRTKQHDQQRKTMLRRVTMHRPTNNDRREVDEHHDDALPFFVNS
jgi:hypothetical protein